MDRVPPKREIFQIDNTEEREFGYVNFFNLNNATGPDDSTSPLLRKAGTTEHFKAPEKKSQTVVLESDHPGQFKFKKPSVVGKENEYKLNDY